jgi:hypothetical protein
MHRHEVNSAPVAAALMRDPLFQSKSYQSHQERALDGMDLLLGELNLYWFQDTLIVRYAA